MKPSESFISRAGSAGPGTVSLISADFAIENAAAMAATVAIPQQRNEHYGWMNKRLASVNRSGAFYSKPAGHDTENTTKTFSSASASGWSGILSGWDYSEVD